MPKRRAVVTIGTLGLERGLERAALPPALRRSARGDPVGPAPARSPPAVDARAGGDLGASRNTVLAAFGQLLAEGYLEGRVGAGTTVARTLPETLLRARPEAARDGAAGPAAAAVPPRRSARRHARGLGPRRLAAQSVPARAARARRSFPSISGLASSPGAGDASRGSSSTTAIRPATRRFARRSPRTSARRGPCAARPSQVIVVTGAQQAVDLAARVLLDPGDTAWIEDPGYQGARGALIAAGIRLAPFPSTRRVSTSAGAPARRPAPGSSTSRRRTSTRSA